MILIFLFKILESSIIHLLKKDLNNYLEKEQPEKKVGEPISMRLQQVNVEIGKEFTTATKRLNTAVKLLFNNEYQKDYPLSRVAETLNFKNETEFNELLEGKTEPTFNFLDLFSQVYGVNKNWLKHGKESPFSIGEGQRYAIDYLKIIKELKPKTIFLVREDSVAGRTGIVLKINDWKYLPLGKSYDISSEVGRVGQIQIEQFYNLLQELFSTNFKYLLKSKFVSKELYSNIFTGIISPVILELSNYKDNKNCHWADDFIDFNHQYSIANNYKVWYGNEFIKAQDILKNRLLA